MKPVVSISLVYYNTPKEIIALLESLPAAAEGISYEVIIVNSASPAPLPLSIKTNKTIRILQSKENCGYGRGHNKAAKKASGKYLLILNPDTLLRKKSLKLMVGKMEADETIGILGPQMTDKEGNVLPTISRFPTLPTALVVYSLIDKAWKNNPISKRFWMYTADRRKENIVDVVSGACMLMKKATFERIGGFDERFFLYFDESDICLRVKKAGHKILYFPKATITHFVGRSSSDHAFIERTFQESRFKFFQKYNGFPSAVLAEGFLRLFQPSALLLTCILLLSLFLNLDKIGTHMVLIGDFGRDFLAARDMLITGRIPLLGIPSSVTWLHQGPLSVYLIGLAFYIGKFYPVSPAVLYGSLGVLATYLVYYIGKMYFSRNIGLLASLLYATSPLVIVNTRMPYHTSPISIVTTLFFIFLYKSLRIHRKYLVLAAFFLGISLQFELSNAVLFFLLVAVWIIYKPIVHARIYVTSLCSFLLGIAPFLLYDLTHHFVQTLGFALWIVNRVRLFFGLTLHQTSTTVHLPGALQIIAEQIGRIIFPSSATVTVGIIVLVAIVIFMKRKQVFEIPALMIVLLWLLIPLIGFAVHAAPGTAYFPLLYAPVSLLIAYAIYQLMQISKAFVAVLVIVVVGNLFLVFSQEYFVTTRNAVRSIPPGNYSIGVAWTIQDDTARRIVSDAGRQPLLLRGGGFFSKFPSSIDDFKYLVWWRGGKEEEDAKLIYTIYPAGDIIAPSQKLIHKDAFITITKQEKRY